MKFQIEDVTVYFPYDNIYPEQYSYMVELKRGLDAKGHCLLEMPNGAGKTIALLSLITSYTLSKKNSPMKLIYCTRTVHEMEKTLAELKLLHQYQVKHLGNGAKMLAIGLSSRKNLSFNPATTATSELLIPPGVYSLQELRGIGNQLQFANVVVCTYQHLLDPKVSGIISKDVQRESVVVFDEAHNIDNVCLEALSVSVSRETLEGANRDINTMIDRLMATDVNRLLVEYRRVVDETAVPGNIRRPEHFVPALRRLVQYLTMRLGTGEVEKEESVVVFVNSIDSQAAIHANTLRFCSERLNSLMLTLEIADTDEFLHIRTVCEFATLVATYARGFSVIVDDHVLQLCCHDASLALKPIFERFQSVVITSGTLGPLDMYPRLLNFNPVVSRTFSVSLARECICPMVLSRGSDQLPVSTKYDLRSVGKNYGKVLLEMVPIVPDGIACFFESFSYMEGMVNSWHSTGLLQEIMQHKLVFMETHDAVETTLALDNYRKACDCGRGAVFFSVAMGKVAQSIDFDRHYGRLVIVFGVPYQYTPSRRLLARLEYLHNTLQIKEGDLLRFDALRQAAQCVSRVFRSKADYGMVIFADKRYTHHDERSKLPGWILSHLHGAHRNLSTDMAVNVARDFLRKMALPYNMASATGKKTLLTEAELEIMGNGKLDEIMVF